jgi:hypothetical protein
MSARWKACCVIGLFVAVNVAIFLIGRSDRPSPLDKPESVGPRIPPQSLPINPIGLAGEVAAGTFTGPSMVSLEMRENVDFLLTPGLLVQQAITEGAIVTYPEE